MEMDEEGFPAPVVDPETCLRCGSCARACPLISPPAFHASMDGRVAYSRDGKIYRTGASGGAFGMIAESFLSQRRGRVCGAAVTQGGEVRHMIIGEASELSRLQGSKYVQSDTSGIYRACRDVLVAGVDLLFSGTPCQVAAMRAFAGNAAGHLYTIDLVCHGVASPVFLKRHVAARFGESPADLRFRRKTRHEVSEYALAAYDARGALIGAKAAEGDAYMNLYVHNRSLRESCYRCAYARPERAGDITLGDVNASCVAGGTPPPMTCLSAALINTEAGRELWEMSAGSREEYVLDRERYAALNAPLRAPARRPGARDRVYRVAMTEPYRQRRLAKYMVRMSVAGWLKHRVRRLVPVSARRKIKSMMK
jgi:coenzyme F420-reducing hydrogenase beta subunit